MIWHFLEVWLLVVLAYLLGSLVGVLVYAGLGRTAYAAAQGALADAIGDTIDGIKTRYGVGPAWRADVKRAAAQSRREARAWRGSEDERRLPPRRPLPRPQPAIDDQDLDQESEEAWRDEPAAWSDAAFEAEALEPDELAEAADLDPAAEDEEAEPAEADGVETGRLRQFLDLPAMRPAGLPAPRNGIPDDLQRIRGIGRRNEELLHSLGIFHFGQIAAWTPAEARWVAAFLAFPERIERDDWIGQATILASGGKTGYVKPRRNEPEESENSE